MSSIDVSGATTPIAGALIYEYRPVITQVVEYGASADAVLSGQPPPAEGARFDFYLEGPISGPKLHGTFRGVDYICFRADGRAELHIHGEIRPRTEAGCAGSGRRGDSRGGLARLPAPRARFPDEQPPRALVGEPDRGLGPRRGRRVDSTGPRPGVPRLTTRLTPAWFPGR